MNRSRENLAVAISADWHSPIISATIYLRVARRGSIIADVIMLSCGSKMLAKQWENLHDYGWDVAQVKSSFRETVDSLKGMRPIRSGGEGVGEHRFTVNNIDAFCLFVVFSRTDSDWTYLESLTRFLDGGIPNKLSKRLKTDVLHCGYDSNSGMSNYECFRNGKIIESCGTGDPEFFDPESDCFECRTTDGKERKWTLNSTMTLRYFSKLDSELDIESSRFNDYWSDISEKLDVNIPYRTWSLACLLYTSPSPRDATLSRMPSSA